MSRTERDRWTERAAERPDGDAREHRREHPLIELQRKAGNRAAAAAIQREPVQDAAGTVTGHRFEVGRHVSPKLAAAAKRAVRDDALSAVELVQLRTAALGGDSSVNDEERLFMAGLLDAANARALNRQSFGPGDRIEFPAASITPARRDQAEAAGRPDFPPEVVRLLERTVNAIKDLDLAEAWARFTDAEQAAVRAIARLTGTFSATAGEALAVASAHGLPNTALLDGMVDAASDGTPGDLALAAVVLAIAWAESHTLYADLAAGRVKVDEVPPAAMPGGPDHLADYVTVAQGSGAKGDTLYLPSNLSIRNAFHWSVVVHELEHAVDDRAARGGKVGFIDRAQAELRAYRAQGASIMRRLTAEPAATRGPVAAQIGAEWTDMVLLGMVLESRGSAAVADPLIREVNAAAPAPRRVSARILNAVLAATAARLEAQALTSIRAAYGITATTNNVVAVDGLAGESIVDWIDRI